MATGKRGRLGIRHGDVYSLGQEPSDRVKSNVQLGHTRFDLIKKQDFSILLQFHRPNVCFTSSYLDSCDARPSRSIFNEISLFSRRIVCSRIHVSNFFFVKIEKFCANDDVHVEESVQQARQSLPS